MAALMGWGERQGLQTEAGEEIKFTAGERRPAIVGDWPPLSQISLEALLCSDPDFLKIRADVLTFDCSNGFGEYLIIGWDGRTCCLRLRRLSSRVGPA